MVAAVVIGIFLACQSRVNGQLGQEVHDGILAALWSFGSGLVVLATVYALSPGTRAGVRRLWRTVRSAAGVGIGTSARALRPWHCLGGVCGAYLVVTQSSIVGLVGVAVFTVAVVAGQAASSLVVDRLGLGPAGRQPVTLLRVVGAVLALCAVLLSVGHQLDTPAKAALAILPALGGVGTAWQQAVNGRVAATASGSGGAQVGQPGPVAPVIDGPHATRTQGALVAALVNFTIGTSALIIAALVDIALRGTPDAFPTNPILYIGGMFGVAFISMAAYVVRITGVLLLGLASVAGQLIGALVLDALLPASGTELSPTTVLGTVLTLVAVAIAAAPARRTPALAR
ncbi:DMT family transporter [Actinopolymorpha pittospori]